MAKICTQQISINISKLVRDDADDTFLTDNQLLTLLETLPGVVEQLLDDNKLVVEATV